LEGFLFSLRRGENFIKPWTQRYLGISDNKSLMLTEDGRDALLDAILPLAWDWKKDIIIIGGGAQEALIPHLINRGQKRCLVIASNEQPLRASPCEPTFSKKARADRVPTLFIRTICFNMSCQKIG
jgi:hypothetical protein